MTVLLVAVGGAAGACLRYLADRSVRGRFGSSFPWGTLTVNAAGSLILGVLTGVALPGVPMPVLHPLLGTGLCGALTTYSTFGYETVRLFVDGARLRSVANAVATVCAGLGCGVLGFLGAAALGGG
ncbi:CrcB protein [Halopolyspora algeriensis]|uniref:Fluoride-specific ion channel FluC n=1 Tax=Halopolyspora algeriensis TaxID=1500506 RepID=A0A368W1U3_9ACTN|nr:fluoride efflux transporter CrcB [Halopolyspora algeriensis]RCW47174.1 CrcB protein [Halopolyspora algeriensis]TQM48260.1 CrcB protein [Halopolyspora algeriensis]